MTPGMISFIVPVRTDAARLDRCLRSILASPAPVPIEIVVGDNGSTDDSVAVARALGAMVVSLPDRPVSAVRNEAAAAAHGEWLAFIDADHELAPGWIAAAVALGQDASVWAAGAEYHPPADGTWVQRTYDKLRSHVPGPVAVDWLPSGNLIVRRSAFDRIGGFDTTLESCEDVDFCRRLREAGGSLIAADSLYSVHHGDPRTLRALFLSELWRGRDNIRVSLREPLTWSTAPSVVIPIVHLVGLALIIVGLASAAVGGAWLAAIGALAALLTAARVVRLFTRVPPGPDRWRQLPAACLVAGTYDAARAMALVGRANHDVRRKA